MELRQLEIFIAIAEELHFGRAAQRLFIAQSSVSSQLQRLENEIGARLVHRSSRRVELTPAGEAFRAEVENVLERLKRAAQTARAARFAHRSTIRIGTNYPGSRSLLLPLLSWMRENCPAVAFDMRELGTLEQERELVTGNLDLGIIYGPSADDALETRLLTTVDIVALARQKHPLAGDGVLDLRKAGGYEFYSGHRASSPEIARRVGAAAALVSSGLGRQIVSESEAVFLQIASSDNLAFASRDRGLQGEGSGLVLLEIEPRPQPLELHVAWNRHASEAPVNIVLDALQQLARA